MSVLHRFICQLMETLPASTIESAAHRATVFSKDEDYIKARMTYARDLGVDMEASDGLRPQPDLTPRSGPLPEDLWAQVQDLGPNGVHVIFVHPTFLPQLATFTEQAFTRNTNRHTLELGLMGYLNDVPVLQTRGCKAACGWILE